MNMILIIFGGIFCIENPEMSSLLSTKSYDDVSSLKYPHTYLNEQWSVVNPSNTSTKAVEKLAKIYSGLKYLLSHYYTFFDRTSLTFRKWYASDVYEMDEDTQDRIVNSLNTTIHSITDLDEFWQETQSSLLESRLVILKEMIEDYKELSFFQFFDTDKNNGQWLIEEMNFIIETLHMGLIHHQNKHFTDVLKSFLIATYKKKKLDSVFQENPAIF